MEIFKSQLKNFESDLKIKLCGKRLWPAENPKYLGVKIDTKLIPTYFAIFDSYLSYCCLA